MKIFVIGPLALPAATGGLSKHTEELGVRLAAMGHEVTVATRRRYTTASGTYKGIRVLALPVPAVRGLETFLYGLAATLAGLIRGADVVHYQGIAAASFIALSRLRRRRRIVLTVHSRDWAFDKWGAPVRALLRATEGWAVRTADLVLAVSTTLAADLEQRYPGLEVRVVRNGVDPPPDGGVRMVQALGLEPGGYVLAVGRLVPEKGMHLLTAARCPLPLVVVGGPRFSQSYASDLRAGAPSARFLGVRTGPELGALYAAAAAYATASSSEGLPTTVLEAMSFALPVVASDIPAHREALGDTGFLFSCPAELDEALRLAVSPHGRHMGTKARERLETLGVLGWDEPAERTAALLEQLLR